MDSGVRGVVGRITTLVTILCAILSDVETYKVLTDADQFQVEREYCEVACYTSAETRVEARPGEKVEFNCRTDREDVEIRKLWTTDGGKYVANNNQSFLDRFTVSEEGATLRIEPVMEEDDQKSLWCSLLLYDKKERRWRPRKTIHHFLYVGEGKMKLNPEDLINLDIQDDNVLYHHRTIDEFDSEQKLTGNLTVSNVSVENIFFNGTMEKDDFHEDFEADPDGGQGGNVQEEKQFIDLGEKFKKTLSENLPKVMELKKSSGDAISFEAARAASNDAPSLTVVVDSLTSVNRFLNNLFYYSTTFVYLGTMLWIMWMIFDVITCNLVGSTQRKEAKLKSKDEGEDNDEEEEEEDEEDEEEEDEEEEEEDDTEESSTMTRVAMAAVAVAVLVAN